MPIENFQIEQEQEQLPVNLLSRENRNDFIINQAQGGDILWLSIIRDGYNKSGRLDAYVKPIMVTIKTINKDHNNPRLGFDYGTSSNKVSHSARYYSDSTESILTHTKEGCAFLHDEKIVRIANDKKFSTKESLYKKLISRPKPQDEALVNALNWQDTLTEEEKGHIQKLIAMTK